MRQPVVGVVTLGDSRLEFFQKRIHIVENETKKLLSVLADKYRVVDCGVVFSPDDSLRCSDKLRSKLVDCVILHIPIWGTPSLSLRIAQATPLPVLLYGNGRPETSSLVAMLGAAGHLSQSGKACYRLTGSLDDKQVRQKIGWFICACHVYDELRRSNFCAIGGRSIGIGTTVADPAQWQRMFGVDFDHADQFEIVRRAKQIDPARMKKHLDWVMAHVPSIQYGERFTAATLELQVRSYLAVKDLAAEKGCQMLAIKCQQEMSDHFVLQCLGVALLNGDCDADGPKEPIVCSCECDCDAALTMRILSLCANGAPSCLLDIKYFDKDRQEIVLANCGACAPYFAKPSDPAGALKRMALLPHIFGLAGGASVQFIAAPGRVTVARLFRRNGRYVLACFEGDTEDRPLEELHKTTWCYPHAFVHADIDYDLFFETMNANHMHMVYGSHIGTLKRLCEMFDIEFLCYDKKE